MKITEKPYVNMNCLYVFPATGFGTFISSHQNILPDKMCEKSLL